LEVCKYFGKVAQMTAFFGLDGKGRDPFYFVCVVAANCTYCGKKWTINGLVEEYGKFGGIPGPTVLQAIRRALKRRAWPGTVLQAVSLVVGWCIES
jgi:hypothetical protein